MGIEPANVLLVDDVNMFLEIQRGFLKNSPVRILTAGDGVEALELVKREQFALVFMDLHMPKMDGAACCAAIKQDPRLRAVPVIMITAQGKEEDKILCQRAGCNGFMTKPINRDIFLTEARRYIPAIDRRETRVPCLTRVKFKAYGITLSADIIDINARGIYIAANYEMTPGTELDVAFTLPDAENTLIQAKGRVSWINTRTERNKPGLPDGFGVEFIAFARDSQAFVAMFVESHLPKK